MADSADLGGGAHHEKCRLSSASDIAKGQLQCRGCGDTRTLLILCCCNLWLVITSAVTGGASADN